MGFRSVYLRLTFEAFKIAGFPSVAYMPNYHYVVVSGIEKHFVFALDPALGYVTYSEKLFKKRWTIDSESGICLLAYPRKSHIKVLSTEDSR